MTIGADPGASPARRRFEADSVLATALAVALIAGFCWAAARLTVEYYDGYEFIMTGKALGGHALYFQPKHLLLSAWLGLADRVRSALGIANGLAVFHAAALLLNLAALLPLLVLVRRAAPDVPVSAVAVLALGNRVLAHYAPFALGDIALVGVAAAGILAAREVPFEHRWGAPARFAAVLLSLLSRPQVVLIPVVLLALECVERRARWPRALLIAAAAGLVHLGAAAAFTSAATGLPGAAALRAYLDFIGAFASEVFHFPTNPWWATLLHMILGYGPVLAGLAVVGAAERRTEDRGPNAAAAVYLLFLLFGLTASDTRYTTPLLPAGIVLAARGWAWLRRRSRLAAALALVALASNGLAEIARFRDPFYASGIHEEISRRVEAFAEGRTVVFVTPLSALFPRDQVFSIHDNAFYLYSWNRAAHAFHSGRRPLDLAFRPGFREKGYPWPDGIERWLGRDFAAVVPGRAAYRTIDLPSRFERLNLYRKATGDATTVETGVIDPNELIPGSSGRRE